MASYISAVVVFSQEIRGWLATSADLLLGFSLWLAVAAIILTAIAGTLLAVDLILNILNIQTVTISNSGNNSTMTAASSNNSQGTSSKGKTKRRVTQGPV